MIGGWQALHPDHAVVGLGIAAGAVLIDRLARPPRWPAPDLAALGLVVWLATDAQLPLAAVGAVALLSLAAHRRGRLRWCALAAGALLVVLGRPHAAPLGALLALVGVAAAVAGTWERPAAPPRLVTAGLVGAALLATVLGGPDTEGAIAGAAALVPALLFARGRRASADPNAHSPAPPSGWTPLVLAVIVCVDAYRGRPAGLTGAAVACAAVAAAAWAGRVSAAGRSWGRARSTLCVGVVAIVTGGAARTIGLDAQATVGSVSTSVVLSGAVAAALLVSAPRGPARTPPG